ncbi:CCD61 protein, partial [Illadopsis cleaveri]|nr:CCD61 protein [Illadopsis cleaveri]
MGEPRYLQAECAFRPGAHTVRVTLTRTTLRVEVEAHGTADLWRGEFDATFIEDLTRKTGNFKQFGIFCSMLESALTQRSNSVSLELLTYTDLETLHSRKVGAVTRPPPSTSSPLNTKRYLILVYSVEFDRIHYPLPLPYAGRPDLVALVRELQEQLAQLRARRLEETQHLRDALWRALEEKRAAEARHQREYRQLAAELTQAKSSEQRLHLRVKNLTAELASYRRGYGTLGDTHPGVETRHGSPPPYPDPLLCLPLPGPREPRFDPTAFVRARQRRQKEAELRKQRRGVASGSTSPARSHRRSSSAESSRSWRLGGSSGSKASEHPEPVPCRRVTRTRRPLCTSSCNGPCMVPRPAASQKLPVCRTGGKRPGKENRSKEPSPELAEIDARLQALQEYMDSLNTRL